MKLDQSGVTLPDSTNQYSVIQYVLTNEKMMTWHCQTTVWSPILASHLITEGLVTTFWNSGRVGGHVYTTDGCSCSWNVLSEKVGKFWLCQFKQLYTTDSRGCSWSVLSVLFTLTSGDSDKETTQGNNNMNPITVFQLASWTIGLWDYWLVGIEAGAGPKMIF